MNECSMDSVELPRYKCHKKVWALKIKEIWVDPGLTSDKVSIAATIVPEDFSYAPFQIDYDYIEKHKPQVGGYYVVYEDGYKSYSPAKAFEEGYTRI